MTDNGSLSPEVSDLIDKGADRYRSTLAALAHGEGCWYGHGECANMENPFIEPCENCFYAEAEEFHDLNEEIEEFRSNLLAHAIPLAILTTGCLILFFILLAAATWS